MNCAYKSEASREGEEDKVSVVRMGGGVKLGGIFKRRYGDASDGCCWDHVEVDEYWIAEFALESVRQP